MCVCARVCVHVCRMKYRYNVASRIHYIEPCRKIGNHCQRVTVFTTEGNQETYFVKNTAVTDEGSQSVPETSNMC